MPVLIRSCSRAIGQPNTSECGRPCFKHRALKATCRCAPCYWHCSSNSTATNATVLTPGPKSLLTVAQQWQRSATKTSTSWFQLFWTQLALPNQPGLTGENLEEYLRVRLLLTLNCQPHQQTKPSCQEASAASTTRRCCSCTGWRPWEQQLTNCAAYAAGCSLRRVKRTRAGLGPMTIES